MPPPSDYFAKPAFYPDARTAQAAQELAAEAIRLPGQDFGTVLSESEQGVQRADDLAARLHEQLAPAELNTEARTWAARLGSYAGEVFRLAHGGTWGLQRLYGDAHPALQVCADGPTFSLHSTALARITRGVQESSLWQRYQEMHCALIQAQARTGGDPPQAPDRELYTLRHDNGDFDAGKTADGRQVLMAFFWTGLTAIFFDPDGKLLEWQVRPLPAEPIRHPATNLPLNTPEFDEAIERALKKWKRELAFRPKLIRVRRFAIDELGLGIEDRPWHHEEFLKDPEAEGEEERQEMADSIRDWEERGCFVLHWGNDLWLNGKGEVEST